MVDGQLKPFLDISLDAVLSDVSNVRDYAFDWECIETTVNEIKLQLKFTNPEAISSEYNLAYKSDELQISFNGYYYI